MSELFDAGSNADKLLYLSEMLRESLSVPVADADLIISILEQHYADKPDDMNDAIERLNEMEYDQFEFYYKPSNKSWGCIAVTDCLTGPKWTDKDGYPTPREAVMAVLAEVEKGE